MRRRSMLACVSMVFNRVDTSPDSVDAMSISGTCRGGTAHSSCDGPYVLGLDV